MLFLKKTITLTLLLGLAPSAALATDRLEKIFSKRNSKNIHFGVSYGEEDSDYTLSENESFLPASTLKVITATTALKRLKPTFQFETEITYKWVDRSQGIISDLRVIGNGDPTWGMEEHGEDFTSRIKKIASSLSAQGVKTIHGSVSFVARDPRWEKIAYPQGWKAGDKTECYGAIGGAFHFNGNCARYQIDSLKSGHWYDPSVPVPVKLSFRKGRRNAVDIKSILEEGDEGFLLTGKLTKRKLPTIVVLPIPKPENWIKALLIKEIQLSSIVLQKSTPVITPENAELVSFKIVSPPLSEIIKPFLKKSLNFVGESLFHRIGLENAKPEESLNEAARRVFKEELTAKKFNSEIEIYDGSGLSRDNRITPKAMQSYLSQAVSEEHFNYLWEALSIAGVDGTLKNRFLASETKTRLRGKTGSVNGTLNLVGFIPFESKDKPFSKFKPFVIYAQAKKLRINFTRFENRVKKIEELAVREFLKK